jgi:hypothetical protein
MCVFACVSVCEYLCVLAYTYLRMTMLMCLFACVCMCLGAYVSICEHVCTVKHSHVYGVGVMVLCSGTVIHSRVDGVGGESPSPCSCV